MSGSCVLVEVIVAIPTFRRPLWLTRLLRALEALQTGALVRVIVADNDAQDHRGADVCDELRRAGYRWDLRAIVVPKRGISQARNALIEEAFRVCDNAFFLAMLDDDEWPQVDWLENLLKVQRETGADIVQGPVLCQFAHGPSAWAELANACLPPRHGSGPIATADAGGNILIRGQRLVSNSRPWFDPQFGLTGGEDKDFFVRMARHGATFAWAADAVAHTSIPESRMSLRWALRRSFRAGNCDMRIARKYDRSGRTLAIELTKLAGALLISPLQFIGGIASPRRRARALCTFARALGKCAAPLGGEYREYEYTHGN